MCQHRGQADCFTCAVEWMPIGGHGAFAVVDISPGLYSMAWAVEYTDEFGPWWDALNEGAQESVAAAVSLLEARGPRWVSR